ncbi:MAG TPA: zf-HC2 domain-containing protein [Gaiellaceae bacterium]|nr:zf-HC2 domain-containing protein [Gaiellaceae bacterium]
MNGDCHRAREWASTELDGELSTFERVLLHAHLAVCASCREFRTGIDELTGALRAAPLEQFDRAIEISRFRRRPRLRLAPAAAAVAVAAVGFGSILASSAVRSGSVSVAPVRAQAATGAFAGLDTMDLRTSAALERLNAFQRIPTSNTNRSLRGGPVLDER